MERKFELYRRGDTFQKLGASFYQKAMLVQCDQKNYVLITMSYPDVGNRWSDDPPYYGETYTHDGIYIPDDAPMWGYGGRRAWTRCCTELNEVAEWGEDEEGEEEEVYIDDWF